MLADNGCFDDGYDEEPVLSENSVDDYEVQKVTRRIQVGPYDPVIDNMEFNHKMLGSFYLTDQKIKEIMLANGFKLKEQPDGSVDLNPYVYKAARALMDYIVENLK